MLEYFQSPSPSFTLDHLKGTFTTSDAMSGFVDGVTVSDIVDLYGDRGNTVKHAQSQVQEIIHSNTTAGIFYPSFGSA